MLQVRLLGERALLDADTGQVLARSPRTLALIAFLVLHAGAPQSRGRLASTFWPDSTEQQALTNLRRELHQLRRISGVDGCLAVTAADLAWRDHPDCRVDLGTFRAERAEAVAAASAAERLAHGRAAVEAYAGELLPGVYDDWVLQARDDLDRECADLCDLVVPAAVTAGDPTTALHVARRRVELQPLEETGYRTLIELQVRLGDRAGAVSSYHRCASVLERELGLQPDPATRAALDPKVPLPAVRRGAAPATDLVGRREELARLGELVTASAAGASSMVLVRGEPGVGKSRLLAEAARLARDEGITVLRAQCYDGSGRLALAPVASWLQEPALRPVLDTLPARWRVEVERLVPPVSARERADPGRGLADAWQRHRFFQGLAQALLGGGRPLLLLLDNLQWCDAETLDFIAFLSGEQQHGLLVALAGRDRDLAASRVHARWLQRRGAGGTLHEITLGPFSAGETAALARLLGQPELSEELAGDLHSATGGFPLFVVEAARAGGLDGVPRSAGVTSVLRTRLSQLGPHAREVAALAAAVGRDFDLALLCEASDLAAEEVVQGLDELWRRRIVDECRTGYDFAHDLLRDAAYDQISPPRRWLLHRRLAQALELLSAGRTDEVAAQLADQYSRAGNPQRAFEHYRRAADLATAVFAHAEAIRHNRAALDLLPRLAAGADRDRREMQALRSLAASLNALRGYADGGLAVVWQRLVDLAEVLGERDSLVESLVGLWATRFVQGRNHESRALAQRALEITAELPDRPELRGQADFVFAGAALHFGAADAAVRHFEQACEQAPDQVSLIIGSHPIVHARAWSAHGYAMLGNQAGAARCAEAAVGRARSLGHPYDLAIALGYGAVTWQLLDEPARLLRATEELETLSSRYRFAYYADWGVVLSGWATGGAAGTARIRQGIAGLRSIGAFARMGYWLALLADTVEDPERRAAVLDAALVTARSQADAWALPQVIRRRDQPVFATP
ncbi:MAG TPA: AAA family ATPase [Marmoricola sp.]